MLPAETKLLELTNTSMSSVLTLVHASLYRCQFTIQDLNAQIGTKDNRQAVQRALLQAALNGFVSGQTRRRLRTSGTPTEKLYTMTDEAKAFFQEFYKFIPEFEKFYELGLTPLCWSMHRALLAKGRSSRRMLCLDMFGSEAKLTSIRLGMVRLKKANLVTWQQSGQAKIYTAVPFEIPTAETKLPSFK